MSAPAVVRPEPGPSFEGEVVTDVLVRFVELPEDAGRVALLTMDNGFDHTKPNVFGPGSLRALDDALDRAHAEPGLVAVALTGKPFIFNVGADLKVVELGGTREQALALGRYGHQVFGRLSTGPVPSFALVNGAAMGGGLEVALHCTYRALSAGAAALALPECFLGLVPGWGGTQLVPRLVGADAAVTVIVENPLNQNRMLKPAQALQLGLFDVVFEPADFLAEALRWVARVVTGREPVRRREVDTSEQTWSAAIERGRALVAARTRGASAAPARALDLIELARTAALDDGFAAEDEALADLSRGDELRAGIYAFDLVQRRAKRPVGAPDKALARPVTKAGVVGAGLMASQLALLFAQRLEVPVVMTDLDRARLDKGVGWVHEQVDMLLLRGKVDPDRANRLKALVTGSLTKDAFADADLVIEAVFEELEVKQQVFAELEAVVPDTCLLMTNTSSLSVGEMASRLAHPERVVGFHFFNPVAVLPLLEVVRADATDDASLATAFAVGRKLKKSCVLVKDAPAFVVNRLLTRFLGEVTKAIDEGTPLADADAALDPLGLPMTPLELLALVGPAVALHVAETMHDAFPDRFYVSDNLRRLVAAGKTAVYGPDGAVDPEVAQLYDTRTGGPSPEQVRERALGALAEEVRLMLDEGVVAEAQDVDLCMLLGAGWPFWNGGVTPYLDRTGVAERVTGRRFLAPGVASVA